MNTRDLLLSRLLILFLHQMGLGISDPRTSILLHKDFDPNNLNHCAQLFQLLQENSEYLLDPQEKPRDTLLTYCKAVLGESVSFYNGLRVKLITTQSSNLEEEKVVGFVAYNFQGTDPDFPVTVRTIAIDREYQRLGLAQALLFKCEQEARDAGKKWLLCAVYSHNDAMLHMTKKMGYDYWKREVKPCYAVIENGKRTDVYTYSLVKKLNPQRAK